MGVPRSGRLARWTLVAATLASGALVSADEPNPEVARFLLEGGKKSCARGDWEDAIPKLEKAREEDPAASEATYWIAYAHDRAGDVTRAVAEYRAYVAATETLDAKDRDGAALRRKATARLDVLAAGDKELAKVESQLVSQLLSFAKTHFLKDGQIAGEAVRIALVISPTNAEAKKLAERLGVAVAAGEVVVPPKSETIDLIAERTFGTTSGWSYADDGGAFTIDKHGGSVAWPVASFESPSSFVYEAEVSFQELYEKMPLLGLAFAKNERTFLAALLFPTHVILTEEITGGDRTELGYLDLSVLDLGSWHRFAVHVEGTTVDVYLDGEKKLSRDVDHRTALAGPIGVFHQRSRVEVRSLTITPRKPK